MPVKLESAAETLRVREVCADVLCCPVCAMAVIDAMAKNINTAHIGDLVSITRMTPSFTLLMNQKIVVLERLHVSLHRMQTISWILKIDC